MGTLFSYSLSFIHTFRQKCCLPNENKHNKTNDRVKKVRKSRRQIGGKQPIVDQQAVPYQISESNSSLIGLNLLRIGTFNPLNGLINKGIFRFMSPSQ